MNSLLHRISERIARLLEREGYLERDSQEGSLLLDGFDDDVINELQGSSITYRIAVSTRFIETWFWLFFYHGIFGN